MLQLSIQIILISIICILWGIPVLLFQKNKSTGASFFTYSSANTFIFLFFSGLLLLSIVTAWACLIFPLNFSLLFFLTTGLIIYLFVLKRKYCIDIIKEIKVFSGLTPAEFIFATVSILLFIILGSSKTLNPDTHIYHTQLILWYNEYGTVPGIANLFPRYGLGSNWLNLISLFRFPFIRHENFTYINTTLSIWFFLWLFDKWRSHSKQFQTYFANRILSLFYLLIVLICLFEWELFRDTANSTNYDFIVTALTIIIISYMLEIMLYNKGFGNFSVLFIALCFSVIGFKLSGIFILLILVFYLSNHNKLKNWLKTFIVAMVILLPVLIKNYITSGYPLFPLTWSPATPEWQLPLHMTDYLRRYIQVCNRFYNNNEIDFTKLPELMNHWWITSWYKGIQPVHKFIILLSLSSVSLLFIKNKKQLVDKKINLLFALLLLMAAGWFLSAPSPRFGYGVLLILAFFPCCFFAGNNLPLYIQKMLIILSITGVSYNIIKIIVPIKEQRIHIIYPADTERSAYKIIRKKGIDFYLPDSINNNWINKCGDLGLPCICQENKYLEPIGKTLKDGFRMDQIPDSIFIRHYIY